MQRSNLYSILFRLFSVHCIPCSFQPDVPLWSVELPQLLYVQFLIVLYGWQWFFSTEAGELSKGDPCLGYSSVADDGFVVEYVVVYPIHVSHNVPTRM
jgi:hypothetical protein